MRNIAMTCVAALAAATAAPAWGQATTQEMMGMDLSSLRSAIQQRYDAALALTVDPAVVSADNSRHIWASEAKVQCGIAIGFLKSGTRDETSISKCVMASDLMNRQPQPLPPPPPPQRNAPPAQVCDQKQPGIIFFDFDSASLPAEAASSLQFVGQNAAACGWTAFDVVGHADRAGSDDYNQGLSQRRADVVADLLGTLGIARSAIATSARGEQNPRVPTEDGVRNPQNRRVEIGVR